MPQTSLFSLEAGIQSKLSLFLGGICLILRDNVLVEELFHFGKEKQVLSAQMGHSPYESLHNCLLNQLTLFVFLNQYGHLKVGVILSLVIVFSYQGL